MREKKKKRKKGTQKKGGENSLISPPLDPHLEWNDYDADDYKWNLHKAKMSSGIENLYDTKVICFSNFKSIQLVKFTKGRKDNHTQLHVTALELD